jgi:hypothetical protein
MSKKEKDKKVNVVEWFDPYDIEHIRAYRQMQEGGHWPKGLLPKNIEFPRSYSWFSAVEAKMAQAWIDLILEQKSSRCDLLVQQLCQIKTLAMKNLPKRAVTFHAIGVATKIAGWDLAAEMEGHVIDPKKVRDIYLEAAGE